MKTRAVEAELFQADGQTDMKLIVAFRKFENAPKNGYLMGPFSYYPLIYAQVSQLVSSLHIF
jgi:hypothetical protein